MARKATCFHWQNRQIESTKSEILNSTSWKVELVDAVLDRSLTREAKSTVPFYGWMSIEFLAFGIGFTWRSEDLYVSGIENIGVQFKTFRVSEFS